MSDSDQLDGPPEAAGPKAKLRAFGVALGLTVAAFVASVLAVVGVIGVSIPLGYDPADPPLLALFVAGQLGFLLAGYLYARRYGLAIPLGLPDRRDARYVIGGTLAALAFATVAAVGLEAAGLVPESPVEALVTEEPTLAIWLAVLSILVVAPAEEYLFRGVVQGRLRQTFGAPAAIGLASLLFGSLHLGNFVGSFATVIAWTLLITGVGVILGVLYERTGTLSVPIAVHAAYNAVLFLTGYLTL
ncbi:CPBP family intramembrane glutamic endopeptidase [Natronorarus salvus]|uniref:CPBP family intramembrane glutamic endopeptidase n=1 Tax=Natronorarus salvus TaxID=3117733 RepID=UPI002F2656A0